MRVLVSGGGGRLGRLLMPYLRERGHAVSAPSRSDVDWTQPQQVSTALRAFNPDRVLALASWTDVARAQHQPGACVRDTVVTTQHAIEACAASCTPLLYVSTDYVHAVLRQQAGAGVYAAAKLVAEQLVLGSGGYVARVAFTTDEQAAGWRWVNGYSLANRSWADELVPMVGMWACYPVHQLERLVELGSSPACTPAELLARRYPDHPALSDIVRSADDAVARRLPVQPSDTRWKSV